MKLNYLVFCEAAEYVGESLPVLFKIFNKIVVKYSGSPLIFEFSIAYEVLDIKPRKNPYAVELVMVKPDETELKLMIVSSKVGDGQDRIGGIARTKLAVDQPGEYEVKISVNNEFLDSRSFTVSF